MVEEKIREINEHVGTSLPKRKFKEIINNGTSLKKLKVGDNVEIVRRYIKIRDVNRNKDGVITYNDPFLGTVGKIVKVDKDNAIVSRDRYLVQAKGIAGALQRNKEGKTELIPDSRYYYREMIEVIS